MYQIFSEKYVMSDNMKKEILILKKQLSDIKI